MFNDPLTLEQCQRLIKQLSATAFPFQCGLSFDFSLAAWSMPTFIRCISKAIPRAPDTSSPTRG
ncbi:hypothetical protein EDD15DRAFT_2219091 [Pisolithus albus]|nr:hypothetical protein EDD15DRAFT_2219091 [Pisolithus albus]